VTDCRGDARAVIRVMVVDDHPMWREGVARDLAERGDLGERGFEVVATAVDGAAALRIVAAARPDVVLMDLHFGAKGPSGAETTRCLIESDPDLRVLVLSASGADADVLAAIQAGASGYLMKSASLDELVDAVRRTAEGDAVFTAGLAGLLLGEYRRIAPTMTCRTSPSGRPRCCARWPPGTPLGRSPTRW
jgi:DNA-binding NarL/FixJ family response regulator